MGTILGRLRLFQSAFCAAGAIIPLGSFAQQDLTDKQILSMGHDKWMESVRRQVTDKDTLAESELKFAKALIRVNEKIIASQPDPKPFKGLQILFANITKNACRLTDHLVAETPGALLNSRKAEVVAVLSLNDYMTGKSAPEILSHSDVWQAFRTTHDHHKTNSEKIQAYYSRQGGYTFAQHMTEFDALGWIIQRAIDSVSKETAQRKQNVFYLSKRMIEMTNGQDPLPYPED